MASTNHDLRLISHFLDRTLTPEEVSQLEHKLHHDADFADLLARCSLTHRQIAELFTEEKLHSLLEAAVGIFPSLPREMKLGLAAASRDASTKVAGPLRRVSDPSWSLLPWSLVGLAAAILIAVGYGVWNQRQLDSRQSPPGAVASRVDQDEPAVAATVTRLSGYSPVAGTEALKLGDQIESGAKVAFEKGLLKLTFECGAEVTLQGPCEFLIENSMLGYLKRGRVTANVPRRAFTFGIRAPGIDFIDLGTDFGINVDAEGHSELHVFEGEVIYRQDLETVRSTDVVHVTENEAVRFESPSTEPSQIEIDRALFAPHFGLRGGSSSNSGLPVTRDLALWLSASNGVIADDNSIVQSWYDLTLGDNKSAEDAYQSDQSARPTLVANAINGMPAVRFDGENDHMFTTPLETTDNQTVLVVCQFSQSAFSDDRIYGGQILNYDGPPTRELTSTLAPGVLQIGEPLLKEEFKPSLVTAQVFAGFVGSTTIEAGRVDGTPVGVNSPVIIGYRYDYDHGVSALMLNGKTCAKARAFAPAALISRKVIGRHAWMELFFHGDLSELLIYNCALTNDETEAITRHLSEKYKILLDDSATLPGE